MEDPGVTTVEKLELDRASSNSDDTMTSTLRSHPPGGVGASSRVTSNGGYLGPTSSDGASDGTSSEEHPEFVEVTIVLPDGSARPLTVEYGKQMMDLLVQVAAGNKLSPAAHTIHVFNEETGRPLDYKASQSVGSLKVSTLHLVLKKQEKKDAKPKSAQPFEKTQRLTLTLPRNQKFVTRVNPKTTLAEIYQMVCEEKHLDPYKYELRHPTTPDQALNMASPLGTYNLNELHVVSVAASGDRQSADFSVDVTDADSSYSTMPRLKKSSSSASEGGATNSKMGYMPGQDGDRKKKKGFLSFLSKKNAGSFKVSGATYDEPVYSRSRSADQHHVTAVPPPNNAPAAPSGGARSHSSATSDSGANSPEPQVIVRPSQAHPAVVAPSRKKRHAPPPPPQPAQNQTTTTTVVRSSPQPSGEMRATPSPPRPRPPSVSGKMAPTPALNKAEALNHSRSSSHSSGFDESNVSPVESPGSLTRAEVSGKTRPEATISVHRATIETADISRSQPQLSTIEDAQPPVTTTLTKSNSVSGHQQQRMPPSARSTANRMSAPPGSGVLTAAALSTLSRKKRRAPPPPGPPGAVRAPAQPKPSPPIEQSTNGTIGGSTSTQSPSEVTSPMEVTSPVDAARPDQSNDVVVEEAQMHTEVVVEVLAEPEVVRTQEEEEEMARRRERLADITKGVDDGAGSSPYDSLERERSRPCEFVPPPPPDSPPPPVTPATQERLLRSFNFSDAGGVPVADSSIQVHVTSPGSDVDLSGSPAMPPVETDSTMSEGSSIQNYEVHLVEQEEGLADLTDKETSSDPEELPLGPDDPQEVILLKKSSLSEFDEVPRMLVGGGRKVDDEVDSSPVIGSGEPDPAGAASDSGHSSSATLDKSAELEEPVLLPENEISFTDDDVRYVAPLNPSDVLAKEEYMIEVERERRVAEAEEEAESRRKLDEAREAAARAAAAYEAKQSPVKVNGVESGPISTSTPMVPSVPPLLESDDTFAARSASPVLLTPPPNIPPPPAPTEEEGEPEKLRQRQDSSCTSDDGNEVFINPEETFISLNDYRVAGIVKEEVLDFSYARHSKPIELPKKETKPEPEQPMVTSLRQRYNRRPVLPREPVDVPDLEALGMKTPIGRELPPPPPAEPAPPVPSEPPEPISIRVDESSSAGRGRGGGIFISPSLESATEPDHAEVIEVIEPTFDEEESTELSIPNEAEPETLERERSQLRPRLLPRPVSDMKPVGILKQTSDPSSPTSPRMKGILKSPSLELSSSKDTEPLYHKNEQHPVAAPSYNTSSSSRIYSSTSSLSSPDNRESYEAKPYSSAMNLTTTDADKDVAQPIRPVLSKYSDRGRGVYGPRPWTATAAAAKFRSEGTTINTNFSDRFNNNNNNEKVTTSSRSAAPLKEKKEEEVRQRMAELGFSPGAEREKENVLEEKSLSLMKLRVDPRPPPPPGVMMVVGGSSSENGDDDGSREGEPAVVSPTSPSQGAADKKSLQSQYEQLQQQFSRWHKQIVDNQALLTKRHITADRGAEDAVQPVTAQTVSASKPPVSPTRAAPVAAATSQPPLRKQPDARYEPPKKSSLDYGGGGRFSTNDLLAARSRLRSSSSEEQDIEKHGICVGRVLDSPPPAVMVATVSVTMAAPPPAPPAPPPAPPSLPRTPAPSTKDFPTPPRRFLLQSASAPKVTGPTSRFEPKLAPREELMIAIRNNGGRGALRRVPVNETKWH